MKRGFWLIFPVLLAVDLAGWGILANRAMAIDETVWIDYCPALRQLQRDTTRIVIWDGPVFREAGAAPAIIELTTPGDLAAFFDMVDVEPGDAHLAHVCKCRSNPNVEFYRGEALISRLFIKEEGKRADWESNGIGDIEFTPRSAGLLHDYFEAHGLAGYRGRQ